MKKARKDNRGRALHKGEYQKPDHSYSYSYTDPFKKRRFIYADTLQELREKEAALVKKQLDGLKEYANGEASVNFLFDRYIAMKKNLKPSTMMNYKYYYNRFVRDGFGKNRFADVKYSDVLYFYNSLLKSGLKLATIDNIHSTIHPAFQLAVRDDLIKRNPSDHVMAELKKGHNLPKTTRHALTVEQQRMFMKFLSENPVFNHWHPLFTILLGTGVRIGELIGLRWDDVDFKKKEISINHSLEYYPQDEETCTRACRLVVSLPKTAAGVRIIPMFPQVIEAFEEIKEVQNEKGLVSEEIDGMKDFIFLSDAGTVLRPQQVNDAIKRVIKYCNMEETANAKKEKRKPVLLPDFSCHHLRHTFCTRLVENESNAKVVQSVMGHKNITTTMDVYAEVSESRKAEAMSKLAEMVDIF